jgi:hypothetical protein
MLSAAARWGLALWVIVGTPCFLKAEPPGPRPRGLQLLLDDESSVYFDATVRSFLILDQRIAWSGVESTYAAEAVLRPRYERQTGRGTWRAQGQFFLNKPMGAILSDPVRDLYRRNFETRPFEIFQLSLEWETDEWWILLGRIPTPMGRYSVPLLTNALLDAPFLRTEIVGFAETGMFLRWRPGIWTFDLGLSNGESTLDTNSTKALLARWGFDLPAASAGLWLRAHDGTGSEQQKLFGSFLGFDAQIRRGRWTIYTEGIIDEHGFYRGDGNPAALGRRSLYHREVYRGTRAPILGGGFHVGVMLSWEDFWIDWNYGVYWPERLGIPSHDEPVKRAMFKFVWSVSPRFDVYAAAIAENSRPQPFVELYNNSPRAMLLGAKFEF